MTQIFDYVKEHPYLIGGGALLAVVGVVIIKSHSSAQSSASYATTGINPQAAALYAQQSQTQAALTGQTNQLNAQQQIATTQAQYGIDLATIQNNATVTATNTAAYVAIQNIDATASTNQASISAGLAANQQNDNVQTTGIEAQLAGLESNNSTSLGLAAQTAAEQENIAGLTAGVQTTISNNQTQLGLAETGAAENIADTTSNNAAQVSINATNKAAQTSGLGIGAGLLGALL